MKSLHRPDLFAWSVFDTARNVDFHGYVWVHDGGNVVFDPVGASEHDLAHLDALGGVAWVVVSNSDHLRAAAAFASRYGATVAGPARELHALRPHGVTVGLADGDEPVPGLRVIELEGSKTPGELAFRVGDDTLITGDLVRCHAAGRLDRLPDAKLTDVAAAMRSIARLADLDGVEAVLVGDGWPTFRDGRARLAELARRG